MYTIILSLIAVILVGGAIWSGLGSTAFDQFKQPESTNSPVVTSTPAPTPTVTATPVSLPPVPPRKVLSGSSHMFQTFNNCGPASLTMALSFFDITTTQQAVGTQLRPYQNAQGDNDDKSVTLIELAALAEEYGFMTYHRPAGDEELLKQFIAADIPVVTRTWLEPGEDIGHYRVVKGYDESRGVLIQDDSLQGKDLEYSYTDFKELWQAFNYEFLVLVPLEKQAQAEAILGELAAEKQAWRKALELADQQLESEPGDMYAQFNRVVALYELGEYEAAITAYEAVAARLPKRMLWYQIEPILAYYQTGQYDRVLSISQTIFESQNRAFSELHYLRGLIYEQQGQAQKASEAFSLAERYNSSEYWQQNLSSIL